MGLTNGLNISAGGSVACDQHPLTDSETGETVAAEHLGTLTCALNGNKPYMVLEEGLSVLDSMLSTIVKRAACELSCPEGNGSTNKSGKSADGDISEPSTYCLHDWSVGSFYDQTNGTPFDSLGSLSEQECLDACANMGGRSIAVDNNIEATKSCFCNRNEPVDSLLLTNIIWKSQVIRACPGMCIDKSLH